MTWTPITPAGAPPSLAPYVSATRSGNTVYVSGTLAMDAAGKTVGAGDVRAQTRNVIESIRKVLQAAGADLKDIAFNQIFLKERADYAAMNEIYREYFGAAPPARFCIFCELVRPEFLVEISSVAHVDANPEH